MTVIPLHRDQAAPTRSLPHNLDAEASILGGVIVRNDVLRELDALETDHFYDMRHRVVWQAMRNLEARRTPIDITTLENEILGLGKLESLGGIAFLGELALRVPTTDNVRHYARIVRDKHVAREIALKANALYQRSISTGDGYEPDELLAEAAAEFAAIERAYRADIDEIPFISVGQAMENMEILSRSPIYETPFPDLNRAIGFGGLLGGQIYYLAAGTGIGKTTWVGAVAQHYASGGGECLVATWEMMAGYFVARIAAGPLGCHSNEIIRGNVGARAVMAEVSSRITFLEKPTLEVLRRGARKLTARAKRPPLIIIDYIQLLAELVAATMNRPDLRQATSIASGVLRDIARELGCPLLVVSGAGRAATKRLAGDIRKVHPAELVDVAKESGAIEFDGAGVIVLSLSEDYEGDEQIATMTLAKARFGEKCHIDMRYSGRSGVWREIGRVQHEPRTKTPAASAQPEEARSEVIRGAVVRDLNAKPVATKTALVTRLKGYRKEVVREVWDQLRADGIITKIGHAFTLTEKGRGEFQTVLPEVP